MKQNNRRRTYNDKYSKKSTELFLNMDPSWTWNKNTDNLIVEIINSLYGSNKKIRK